MKPYGIVINWIGKRANDCLTAGAMTLASRLESLTLDECQLCVEWGECYAWDTRDAALRAAKAVAHAMRASQYRACVKVNVYVMHNGKSAY